MGRLYAKRVNGTIIEKYVHDGDSIIADYSGTNQLIRRYIRGTGVDEIVGYLGYSGGSLSSRRYVHSDYLGSIIATSNDGGQLVDTYRYSVYGEVDDPSGMPYRFTGRRYDGETNLYYYRARWYSPALGRFMQTDPIGYEDNINWYAYVNNDPINNTDPSGQFLANIVGAFIGAAVDATIQYTTTGKINYTQVAVAAVAGATGVGAAKYVAQAVREFGGAGLKAVAGNAAGNAVAGATINTVAGLANDAANGESLGQAIGNIPQNAGYGALGGAAGSVAGDSFEAVLKATALPGTGAAGAITAGGQRAAGAAGNTVDAITSNTTDSGQSGNVKVCSSTDEGCR